MTTGYVLTILFLALIAGSATFLGVLVGYRAKGRKNIAFGLSFAGAIMILISVFELIPAANRESNILNTIFFVIVGAAVVSAVNFLIPHIHAIREIENYKERNFFRLSMLLAVGLILHDFPEGFAIPTSFGYSSSLGFTVIIATFIHNIPEGYAMTCASAECQKKHFFYKSALLSTISTFCGAGLSLVLLSRFAFLSAVLLSIAAGAMLYISLHELLPFSKKYGSTKSILAGLTMSVILYLLLQIRF